MACSGCGSRNSGSRKSGSRNKGGNNGSLNCVCNILADIKKKQDMAHNSNKGCVNDFCSNGNNNSDTIPVVITTKANTILFGFIDLELNECEITVYFRVNDVNQDTGCVQLEMLLPNEGRRIDPGSNCCIPLNQVCTAGGDLELTRTGQCISVDCDCLCQVQCLDPSVVVNGNGGTTTLRRRG